MADVKRKAYLAWPVRLRGRDKEYHITAKYLGESPFTIEDITRRLNGIDTTINPELLDWMQGIFDYNLKVMLILGLPRKIYKIVESLESLSEDDYPDWRPHITLGQPDKLLWYEDPNFQDVVESIGPLTLYVDKVKVHEWR